ncbi:hypothetical protein BGZ68_007894 [Mortierella alpina]|nr:hypothetical protein BGZ68_007894 [Mortierella alpina]
MPPSTNLTVLKQAFKHLNTGNINGCLSLMRPDFIINIAEMPYPKRGHDAWRKHAELLLASIPDVKVQVEDAVSEDDKVAVRVRIQGTHLGEFMGCPPTGQKINYLSHEIYRFEDGKIAEEWICSDSVTMLRQMGALSTGRLVAMWLSGYRFWAGLSVGAIVAGVAQYAANRI